MSNKKGQVGSTPDRQSSSIVVELLNDKTNTKGLNQFILYLRQSSLRLKRKSQYIYRLLVEKPRWFLVFLLGRFNVFRHCYKYISKIFARPYLPINVNADSLFDNLDVEQTVEILRKDGIFMGISLPEHILSSLLDYLNSQICFAGGKTDLGFKISEKEKIDKIYNLPFYVARYFNLSSSCPSIHRLANDPKIRDIAINYIGNTAKYTGASLFWTFPIQGTSYDSDQQEFGRFHYDIDDFSSLRFCFYLSDVTQDSGPHICIRGSHVKKSIYHVSNYFSRIQPEKKLIQFYGQNKFLTLTGKSGFGFIEDTFCFHKGIRPTKDSRLFLQLHFAANNYNAKEHHDYRDPNTLKQFG